MEYGAKLISANQAADGLLVHVSFDGGCYNNPNGKAASGAVIRDVDGKTLGHVGRAFDVGSNNFAEWNGLIIGLEAARELGAIGVHLFGDSQLVLRQFEGQYSIRHEALKPLALRAFALRKQFARGVTTEWVPREQNRDADAICSAVLRGTYLPDADLEQATSLKSGVASSSNDVEITFVTKVRMDPAKAREALARGATPVELRKQLAARAESRLIMAGQIGEFSVTPGRAREAK